MVNGGKLYSAFGVRFVTRRCDLELLFGAGRRVDGRDIMVQFAKYGPNVERK
jgi:hypothetical protein